MRFFMWNKINYYSTLIFLFIDNSDQAEHLIPERAENFHSELKHDIFINYFQIHCSA